MYNPSCACYNDSMYTVHVVVNKAGTHLKYEWRDVTEEMMPLAQATIDHLTIHSTIGKLVSKVVIPQVMHVPAENAGAI